jgi:hypothetical protein
MALATCGLFFGLPPRVLTDARAFGTRQGPQAGCDRFASPRGSDTHGRGTLRSPFASLSRLDRSLTPGQTGCLRAGTYGNVNTEHRILNSGASSYPITIRAYPGERAKVVGWVDVKGSYTTLSHLQIDGSNTFYTMQRPGTSCGYPVSQGLAIAGHDDVLEYDDYYQSVPSLRGNGIGVGWWGDADNTVIRHDKIHDVGGCDFYDHLIYLARGNNAQIYDNWLWNDTHGWGIKLDPGPTDARIWGNVIDGAGSGFNFGNSSHSSPTAGNLVYRNIVMNSVGVSNPDLPWSHPGVLVTSPGLLSSSVGNRVYGNDSYGNPGGIQSVASSVTPAQLLVTDNSVAQPHFVDAAGHDYTLLPVGHARRRRRTVRSG